MIIVCPSCQRQLSLDENQLPMREVVTSCPKCQAKLTVDRRKLGTGPQQTEANAPARLLDFLNSVLST